MKCPFCGEDDTRVIDSRPADENMSIRRRRQCDKCQKRFTTYEKVEAIPLVVIKKDQTREPYDRTKIEKGVFRSCHKRPISVPQMNHLVDQVEARYLARKNERYQVVISENSLCDIWKSWMQLHTYVLHRSTVNSKMSIHLWKN